MPTEKPRFTVTLPEDLLKAIDDFRFENRFNTRAEAVVFLLRKAIALENRGTDQRDRK